ncbi:hypothetical protein CHK_0034 [Christensenella hongkongensis]|uniref:Uncharacterized protein n=1 Tax=Christensenella hongkongensis TaxID=270498 RepID=A0A0M2NN76_9FIRM|nr:hypothetical protein CHK_0031 [Christensenella hongkongensis]KKI52464.1 hypothetical protein CHK_0034 [Christensenella hongkongensis]
MRKNTNAVSALRHVFFNEPVAYRPGMVPKRVKDYPPGNIS